MNRIARLWLGSYMFLLLASPICFYLFVGDPYDETFRKLLRVFRVLCLFFIPNIFLLASYVHQCFGKLYRYKLKWQYAILSTAWCNISLLGFVYAHMFGLAIMSICVWFVPVVLISLPIVFVIKKWRELKTGRVRTTQADDEPFERLSTEKNENTSYEIPERSARKNHLSISFKGLLILWGVAAGAFYSGMCWLDNMLSLLLVIICGIVNYGLSIEVMRRFMQRSPQKFNIKEMVMLTILCAHSLVLMSFIPVSIIAIVPSFFVCIIMLCGSPVCFGGDETDKRIS